MDSSYERYKSDEPLKTIEEREDEERAYRIAVSRYEFHAELDFDAAVEKLESFDRAEPFVPGELRKYGERRVYFRVFESYFMRTSGYTSLSVYMEESPRFGVDILAIASGGGQGIFNLKSGVNEAYVNSLKKHLGVEIPKESVLKKAKRYLFE